MIDWHEIDGRSLGAVHPKILDLPPVIASRLTWAHVVPVTAANREDHSSLSQAACLALHAREALAIVDHEVVTGIFAERNQHRVAALS
jgi:hypothetical protein